MGKGMTAKQVCAKVGLACFVLLVVWIGLVYVLQVLLLNVAPAWLENIWVRWLLNDVPLYCVALPLFILVLRKVPNGADPERQKLRMTPLRLLQIFGVCLGFAYLANLVTSSFTIFLESLVPGFSSTANLELVWANDSQLATFLFAVLVPAVGEEFVFRYLLHKKLRGASDKTYILLSGLLFGVFHASFSQILYAMVIGMVLAWVYTQTRNILYPMGIHFTINFTSAVLLPWVLERVDVDMNALLEMTEESEAASLSAGYLLTAFLGLLIIVVIGCAIALFAMHYRNIVLSLRPPAEPGWPYKPPRRSQIDQRKLRGGKVYNPYGGEDWRMPPAEDEVLRKPSPLPDYSRAMEEYRSHQEVAQAEQKYDYLSGVPYAGPKNETLENLPIGGWVKTCLLNYGMLAYFIAVLAYMAYTLLSYIIFL